MPSFSIETVTPPWSGRNHGYEFHGTMSAGRIPALVQVDDGVTDGLKEEQNVGLVQRHCLGPLLARRVGVEEFLR